MSPIDLESLGDQPLSDRPTLTPLAVRWVEVCNLLLDNPKASWGWDTIEGIRQTIQNCGQVTPGQQEAVEHIRQAVWRQEEAGEDRRTRGGHRRYEGWSR